MTSATTGEITFFQSALPPLPAEAYTLKAHQDASANGTSGSYDVVQALTIDGPRFSLPPTDVVSSYPPTGTQGQFALDLPHVVLGSVELPWIRTLGITTPAGTPWLALLSLYPASESNLYKGPFATTVGAVAAPPDGTAGPQLGPLTDDEKAQGCTAIDVDTGLFTAIAPTVPELFYLAHARSVDTSAKEAGAAQAGFYSVVVGNRFPDHDATTARETLAVLVSLDGIGPYLQPGGSFPSGATLLRLVVLASWIVRTAPFAGDFAGLLEAMQGGAGGLSLVGFPHAQAPLDTPEQKYAEEALDIGYVPMPHLLRTGERTTSWYRGPLVPYVLQTLVIPAYTASDALERYDPKLGLFDVSQATAWQIGRLLALADRGFAQAVMQWTRGWQVATARSLTEECLGRRLGLPFADGRSRKRRQFEWLRGLLFAGLVPRVAEGAAPTLPCVPWRRRRLLSAGLPGIVPPSFVDASVRDGRDPVLAVAAHTLSARDSR